MGGSMTRGPDGKFDDDALANILQTATETPAGAYRARGHPAVFRAVEVMSIEQGRSWGVCTMNESARSSGSSRSRRSRSGIAPCLAWL